MIGILFESPVFVFCSVKSSAELLKYVIYAQSTTTLISMIENEYKHICR